MKRRGPGPVACGLKAAPELEDPQDRTSDVAALRFNPSWTSPS